MATSTLHIEAERVDDLPILVAFTKHMGVPDVIDQVVTDVHGHRTGLSYGQLAWGLRGAMGTRGDHRPDLWQCVEALDSLGSRLATIGDQHLAGSSCR